MKPFLPNRSQRNEAITQDWRQGVVTGNLWISDMFGARKDVAWVTAATPIRLVHAGPGPATRTVNAANAFVSLPVIEKETQPPP